MSKQLGFPFLDEEDEAEEWVEVGCKPECPVCRGEVTTFDGSIEVATIGGFPWTAPTTPPAAPTAAVDSTPPTMESLRKVYEDKVNEMMSNMEKVHKLIMYRQLHHEGLRFDTTEADIRRELSRELKNA